MQVSHVQRNPNHLSHHLLPPKVCMACKMLGSGIQPRFKSSFFDIRCECHNQCIDAGPNACSYHLNLFSGAGKVVRQANFSSAALVSYMGGSSCSGCSTSAPDPSSWGTNVRWLKPLSPCIHVGNQKEAPGCQFWIGLTLTLQPFGQYTSRQIPFLFL